MVIKKIILIFLFLSTLQLYADKKAIGFTIDFLPTIMSATEGELGFSGQTWFVANHNRIRAVGAFFQLPETIVDNNKFENQNMKVAAIIYDYIFGENIDGFWLGTGVEFWFNDITEKEINESKSWNNFVYTIGGGYIYKFYKNFYIEPWCAAHLVINNDSITINSNKYQPKKIQGEISLKIGWHFDL